MSTKTSTVLVLLPPEGKPGGHLWQSFISQSTKHCLSPTSQHPLLCLKVRMKQHILLPLIPVSWHELCYSCPPSPMYDFKPILHLITSTRLFFLFTATGKLELLGRPLKKKFKHAFVRYTLFPPGRQGITDLDKKLPKSVPGQGSFSSW